MFNIPAKGDEVRERLAGQRSLMKVELTVGQKKKMQPHDIEFML